jgi:hypothetical protein
LATAAATTAATAAAAVTTSADVHAVAEDEYADGMLEITRSEAGRPDWAIFRILGDFLHIGRFFASWAIFRLLGDFSPLGRFFASWAIFRLLGLFAQSSILKLKKWP